MPNTRKASEGHEFWAQALQAAQRVAAEAVAARQRAEADLAVREESAAAAGPAGRQPDQAAAAGEHMCTQCSSASV